MRFFLLLSLLAVSQATVVSHEGKRLIQTHPDVAPEWLTLEQVQNLIHQDLNHFMDITDYPDPPTPKHPKGTMGKKLHKLAPIAQG